jgi:hypothetical protein
MTTLITLLIETGRDLLGIAAQALAGNISPEEARDAAATRVSIAGQQLQQLPADQAADYDVLR